MSRIDPNNSVVLVRDTSDAMVRLGVSSWQQLREVVRTVQIDDRTRLEETGTHVGKTMNWRASPASA